MSYTQYFCKPVVLENLFLSLSRTALGTTKVMLGPQLMLAYVAKGIHLPVWALQLQKGGGGYKPKGFEKAFHDQATAAVPMGTRWVTVMPV